ncbi:methyltransferase domain-containing protein [Diaminobutyricimonas sp. TR449]|uniref:class I SAM-dependent methyltransferase n=1 Tax=Diaminobutyricimonas sp. TR449 TaxID=2708076 RepID=UPI00141FC163|nr:methyltransferase domain-containing protein [Diaminobutyricimonas sp. TR449]
MKRSIRRIISGLERRRYVGRLVKIGGATWRGPELRAQLAAVSEHVSRVQAVHDTQLTRLFETITSVHHRQQSMSVDEANLVRSVPVALRRAASANRIANERLEAFSADLRVLESRLAELENPEGLHADRIASLEGRVEEHAGTLTYLLERLEFVRSELLFEMRYGANPARQGGRRVDETAGGGFEAPEGDIRLNLGSGHIPLEGYVNVDTRDLPGVDLVADAAHLPFEANSVTEIFSAHFLEHFPEEQLTRVLLPEFHKILKSGGLLRAVVPDVDAMIRAYVANDYSYADMKQVIYGGQDYDGDFHFNMFTESSMADILKRAGFVDVVAVAVGRPNGKSLELEITARKASTSEASL